MGYIGSHTALLLINQGHQVTILDNLANSKISVLDNLQLITSFRPNFIQADVLDTSSVEKAIQEFTINAVIHFAGVKAVGESVENPLKYHKNNVQGTISLIEAMKNCNIKNLVFSSSATVYGVPSFLPINEEHPINPNNPYGKSKFYIEQILTDIAQSDEDWNIVNLRYFNPVGSHASGLIGDDPNGIPNNLMPYINQVASKHRPHLNIFGNDYKTSDGTGIRDYIHVEDLSDAHLAALHWINRSQNNSLLNINTFNIGTGVGYSVMEIIQAYENINKIEIPYKITPRRLGDIASCYSDPSKAQKLLHWKAKRTLEDMCSSSWKFQRQMQQLP